MMKSIVRQRMHRLLTCAVCAWLSAPICTAWAEENSGGGGQCFYW